MAPLSCPALIPVVLTQLVLAGYGAGYPPVVVGLRGAVGLPAILLVLPALRSTNA